MNLAIDMDRLRFLPAGESCVFVEFSDDVDISANDAVTNLKGWFDARNSGGLRECLPTYRSLAIYFDPLTVSMEKIIADARIALHTPFENKNKIYTVISVPVCYGGEYGPDIENVARHAGLTVEGVISAHTKNIYHCYMIGFIPGFAYLGGMDEAIAMPRLPVPRSVIPGGSVGIAGKQTGVYPLDSPGGWQLIGRTPLMLFMPESEPTTPIKAGYGVRFVRINKEQYEEIAAAVADGSYKPELTVV